MPIQKAHSGRSSGSRLAGVTTAAGVLTGGPANSPLSRLQGEAEQTESESVQDAAALGLGELWQSELDYLNVTVGTATDEWLVSQFERACVQTGNRRFAGKERFLFNGTAGVQREFEPATASAAFGKSYACWQIPSGAARYVCDGLLLRDDVKVTRADHVFRHVCEESLSPRACFESHWRRSLGEGKFDRQCEFKGLPQSRATGYITFTFGLVRCYREDWSPNHKQAYLLADLAPPPLMRTEVQLMGEPARVYFALLLESRERAAAYAAGWIEKIARVRIAADVLPPQSIEQTITDPAAKLRQLFLQYGPTIVAAEDAGCDVVGFFRLLEKAKRASRKRDQRHRETVNAFNKVGVGRVQRQVWDSLAAIFKDEARGVLT